MNPFFESFLKEIGAGLAKAIWIGIIILCAVAGFSLPKDMIIARVILLCLLVLLILSLSIYIVYRYRSYRKKNKPNKDTIVGASIPFSDILVVSELHHPDLRDPRYSSSVLWCSIVNKSDVIVTINNVIAYDSADRLLPIAWSSGLKDDLGNLSDFTGLLAIKAKETASVYLRHRHSKSIFICKIEIYHSLSDKPITKTFDDTGWKS